MTADTMKLYKLIVLYFLKTAQQEISNAILSDFILEYGYTNYFSIQETLADLKETELIHVNQTKSTAYYSITDKGIETLDFFSQQLPADTIQQIKTYQEKNRIPIAKESMVRTDYTKTAAGEYLANCMVTERGNTLFSITLSALTELDAINICQNFKNCSDQIYSCLLEKLNK
ncbi:MAG: DUF4364 family protein [Clostridiaceae bacterium]|nr:DUF4364 family protein [Clostridiaceae bacterium]